jgi:hypothetical protein
LTWQQALAMAKMAGVRFVVLVGFFSVLSFLCFPFILFLRFSALVLSIRIMIYVY